MIKIKIVILVKKCKATKQIILLEIAGISSFSANSLFRASSVNSTVLILLSSKSRCALYHFVATLIALSFLLFMLSPGLRSM